MSDMSDISAMPPVDGHPVHIPNACAHCDIMRARGDERYMIGHPIGFECGAL